MVLADDTVSPREIQELADAMGCRTQTELAQRLSVTQPRVSQILSGAYPVKKGPLMQLIRTLQATFLQKPLVEGVAMKDRPPTARQKRTRSGRGGRS